MEIVNQLRPGPTVGIQQTKRDPPETARNREAIEARKTDFYRLDED